MKLPIDQFKAIVRDSVLVSLDLLLINEREELLVGLRMNRPAQGYLFVPGGRVMKGETLTVALRRVVIQETGLTIEPDRFVLQGIYDHVYSDSCFDDPDISTQYVVIACRCSVESGALIVADQQHERLHFAPIAGIFADPRIHPYVKSYFLDHAENRFLGFPTAPSSTSLLMGDKV